MESPENSQNELSGSEQKVNEYVQRIRNGESAESVMQGLPASFREGIEKKLSQEQDKKPEQKELAIIPPQYEGLDSESLDFIWTIPEYLDPEKTKQEKERKANALAHVRGEEEKIKNKEQTKLEEQKRIDDLRKQLGAPEKQENNPFQMKDPSEFGGDEQLAGIYNTMMNIGAGATEGLREDFERKIQQYVNEIKSGKDKEYVLQGIPKKWKEEIEKRLAPENSPAKKEQNEGMKSFDSLSESEIESFIKTLPRIPVAEGSRFTTIEKSLLPTQNGASLKVGDKVYTNDGYKQVTGEVISKDSIGGVTLKLSDGRNFPTIPNLTDTYLLEDIRKVYEKR